MNNTVDEVMLAVREESIRAFNEGRPEDREPFLTMMQRLRTVQHLDDENATRKLVLEQALDLLHRVWEERPV